MSPRLFIRQCIIIVTSQNAISLKRGAQNLLSGIIGVRKFTGSNTGYGVLKELFWLI